MHMRNGSLKFPEEDDWGEPKRALRPQPKGLSYQIRRLRLPILVTAILAFFYWNHGRPTNETTDWNRFAYVQIATDPHTMCNALMVFEALKRLGSKADRILLYPETWNADTYSDNDRASQLLILAKKSYGVKLKPTQLLGMDGPIEPGTFKKPSNYKSSITKLRVFELDEYERVLYFDNDVDLQQHMDELFFLPSTPLATPRSYWSGRRREEWPLTSVFMLVEPDAPETKQMWERLQLWRLDPTREEDRDYVDSLINERFGSSALVLPHRPYLLQSAEFREEEHEGYMGTFNAPLSAPKWDPFVAKKEAKLIHFNDRPLPKPWIMWPIEGLAEIQPSCGGGLTGTCGDREVWKNLYDDFRLRRKDVCKMLSVPAPQSWSEFKNATGWNPDSG